MVKKVGFIGLGKMGNAMVMHMLEKGIEVVVYNRTREKTDELVVEANGIGNLVTSYTIEEFVAKTKGGTENAIIWLMIKAGAPVDELLFEGSTALIALLQSQDIIIDGGNSYYQDTMKRAEKLSERGIHFMDSGTSGGISGARHGACLMIGGEKQVFENIEWLYKDLAVEDGYGYMGKSGSGHYVKMVHNAVEYGMMQSIAEGLDLLENGAGESLGNALDLRDVLKVWNHGSIVTSYLTQVTENALREDQHLEKIGDFVEENGEGAWTILEAIKAKIPFLTVTHALFMRYTTQRNESFAMKVVAAQRNQFGGHAVKSK